MSLLLKKNHIYIPLLFPPPKKTKNKNKNKKQKNAYPEQLPGYARIAAVLNISWN